jgi:hypothetical protein
MSTRSGSETLKCILEQWIGDLPKDDAGVIQMPFDLETFCRDNDARLTEAREVIGHVLDNFTPEHMDAMSGTFCGTKAKAWLAKWGK